MLMKIVSDMLFEMSEAEVRKFFKYGVGVYYAFDNYECSIDHIMKLRAEVLKEYPYKKDSDMDIRVFTNTDTSRFASHTTLAVVIPVEDYLRLRKTGMIKRLDGKEEKNV